MAKDFYHQTVIDALLKDGWIVSNDPLIIKSERLSARLEIDLALEKTITAERMTENGIEKIAVEVKSFTKPSLINEFHSVVGQYFNYLIGLEELKIKYDLYLAMPLSAYDELSQIGLFNLSVERLKMKIIVFNPKDKTVVKWKK